MELAQSLEEIKKAQLTCDESKRHTYQMVQKQIEEALEGAPKDLQLPFTAPKPQNSTQSLAQPIQTNQTSLAAPAKNQTLAAPKAPEAKNQSLVQATSPDAKNTTTTSLV